MSHATVKIGEFTVPLIGVPASAAEETCDCCGDIKLLREVEFTGKQFLCHKCKSND